LELQELHQEPIRTRRMLMVIRMEMRKIMRMMTMRMMTLEMMMMRGTIIKMIRTKTKIKIKN
jgi:hypothetical protein